LYQQDFFIIYLSSIFPDYVIAAEIFPKILKGNNFKSYVIVVLLVIGWVIGFLGYIAGRIMHVLLVIAVVLTIFKAIRGRKII